MRGFVLGLVVSFLAGGASYAGHAGAEPVPKSSYSAGDWEGLAFSDDNGRFSHCTVRFTREEGDTFHLYYYHDLTLYGLSRASPVFVADEVMPMTMTIDAVSRHEGEALASDRNFVFLRFFDFPGAKAELKKARAIHFAVGSDEVVFETDEFGKALDAVELCAFNHIQLLGMPEDG